MTNQVVRFRCDYCKKVLAITLSDDFCKKFKQEADKWPYPLVYPHNNHWAIIFLDEEFKERGVTASRIGFKE